MSSVPLIIFGLGRVGRTFLRQLVSNRQALAQRLNLDLVVVGLAALEHMVFDPAGLTDERLLALVKALESGDSLLDFEGGQVKASNQELLARLFDALDEVPIIIDTTNAQEMASDLIYALDQGCCMALTNGRALVGPWSTSRRFFESPHVRFEATVGYICSQLQLGVPFSAALAQAQDLGYTEHDPREDLNGQDSARKILIMGRLAGWPLEMRDVQVERLCSPNLASLPPGLFMERVSQLDDNMAQRVQVAREEGCVLRYVAEIDAGGARVGLRAVPRVSQLGVLQGSECLVTIFTARYTVSPLTISGRGVGPELGAAALLRDVVSLAGSRFRMSPIE